MSQGSANVPTSGPDTPTNFAGEINTAFDALFSKNSGAAAPTNFPTTGTGASQGQEWFDTSPGGGLIDDRVYDSANWVNRGALDTTNHIAMPKVGGGSGTIAAAGTTDLGSIRHSYILVTGSVPGTPITSFSNNALLATGETKFVRMAAAGILTYNAASMILPGGADLPFNVGDTFQAVYLSGGNWLVYDYTPAAAFGRITGDMFPKYGTGTERGAVRVNGRTIGNVASGATERANADTVNLWIYLYLQDANLTVSGGRSGATRATAITDYNANKTITLPDARFRSPQALDDMGAAAAGRSTGATFSSGNATTLGSVGGEAAHTLSTAELATHAHVGNITGVLGATNLSAGNTRVLMTGTGTDFSATIQGNPGNASTANSGSGTAHNNMQPFILVTWYLAL